MTAGSDSMRKFALLVTGCPEVGDNEKANAFQFQLLTFT